MRDLDALANGRPVRAKVDRTVVMKDIGRSRTAIYSVMALSGYLRAEPADVGYDLSIPNKEMRSVFAKMMEDRIHPDTEIAFGLLFSGLETGEAARVREGMQRYSTRRSRSSCSRRRRTTVRSSARRR